MRQIHGLEIIHQQANGKLNPAKLADILLSDLQNCRCQIYGCIAADSAILLAELSLLPETLTYEMFDQRLDFCVAGAILRSDTVPLTYRLQGKTLGITGRCSMIPRVCGVDLYLQHSYTGRVGDIARQKFSLPLKPLLVK